ncbi:MAG: Hsp20/alpha crystallin family protein [Steroidobacterales bacterium]
MAEINIQKVAKADDRKLPVFEEAERMMQRIRERAFALFGARAAHGQSDPLGDWLAAERELCWPASELVEQDQNYALNMALAGFEPKDITVTATPRELVVCAKKEASRGDKTKEKNQQVCWSEFRSNDVYRRVELPVDIQVGKVSANYENGLLKITAPKAQQAVAVRSVPAAA